MTPLLVYLTKVVICSGILYAYYYAMLRNNRFHQWNRYYLLLCTLLSLVVPLLRIPMPFTNTGTETIYVYTSQVVTLREQVLTPSHVSLLAKVSWTTWIYTAVLLVLLLRIAAGYAKIISLIRNSRVEFLKPYWLVLSEKIAAPFSFFRYIFWNSSFSAETTEGRQILRHEMVHLQERHSTDKFFMEMVTACCWINPFFHLIKRELSMIHEFIADKKAVVNGDVAEYAQSILQMALQSKHAFNLTNSFSHQPIKRRILMLTQSRNLRFSYLRRLLILPLAVLIFCSLAFVAREENLGFNNDSAEAPAAAEEKASLADIVGDKAAPKDIKVTKQAAAATSVNKATHNTDTTLKPVTVTAYGPKIPPPPPPRPAVDGARPVTAQDTTDPQNEVFTFVEQPPTFPGGQEALAKYLSKSLVYPPEALSKNISGTVFVTFIVRYDGTIQGAKTVGARKGGGLEEEAVRVVKEMPRWKPGKQNNREVSVQFNLPIRFVAQKPQPAKSSDEGPKVGANGVYRRADQMPIYPGGEQALARYLSTTIRYPKTAIEGRIQGNVMVSFTVLPNGETGDVNVISRPLGGGLEEEGIRLVKNMPKWKPAMDGGKEVPAEVRLPINFQLH